MQFKGALLASMLMLPILGHTHSDAYLDKIKTPHGGQVRMSGPFHFELVPTQKQLMVYVTDHADKKISTKGASATAVVLVGDKRTAVKLVPGGENSFRNSQGVSIAPSMKVVLSVNMPGHGPLVARFSALETKISSPQMESHAGH